MLTTPIRKLGLLASQLLCFDAAAWAQHDYGEVFCKSRRDISALLEKPLSEAAVLVLGCGYNYPDVILYASEAHRAEGVEVLSAFYRDGLRATYRDLATRESRKVWAFLEAASKQYHYRRYYRQLERVSGVVATHKNLRLHSYAGDDKLPFDDGSFDVVLSNAVLEHVQDCDQVASELARITRPGGITHHLWHNYYSFSGGNMPESVCRQHPWGHLRDKYSKRGLNKLRPEQVRAFFGQHLRVLDVHGVDARHNKQGIDPEFEYEHPELLSAELAHELRDYPRDLLFTRAYLIIGRKAT